MKNSLKRISLLLIFAMLITSAGLSAFAVDEIAETGEDTEEILLDAEELEAEPEEELEEEEEAEPEEVAEEESEPAEEEPAVEEEVVEEPEVEEAVEEPAEEPVEEEVIEEPAVEEAAEEAVEEPVEEATEPVEEEVVEAPEVLRAKAAKSFKVTFETDKGTAPDVQTVKSGETAVKPDSPTAKGYVFKGWYLDGKKYSFGKEVTEDITLKAKWVTLLDTASFTYKYDPDKEVFKVTVNWTYNKDNYTGDATVRAYKSKTGSALKKPAPKTTTKQSAVMTVPADGSKYFFKVSAEGKSKWTISFTAGKPFACKKLKTYAGVRYYKATSSTKEKIQAEEGFISLYWEKNLKAASYKVYQRKTGTSKWKLLTSKVTNDDVKAMPPSSGVTEKRVKYVVKGLDPYTSYDFKVVAVNNVGTSSAATVTGKPIRPINYVLTLKADWSGTAHDGSGRTVSYKAGQKIKAHGFNGGKYVFKKNGNLFYIAKVRASSITADYASSANYKKVDAENFVNTMGIDSDKSTLIWVSTYSQHVYYFTGSKGNWKCINDWECATGKAISPTPTGQYGIQGIVYKNKNPKKNGLYYWSYFTGDHFKDGLWYGCAFHGKLRSWNVGTPASGGCVRNPTDKAQYIFNNAPKGSKVLVF